MAASPGSQADQEEVRVYDTDYASFALLLSRRNSGSQSILRVSLLCECTPPLGGAALRSGVGPGEGPPGHPSLATRPSRRLKAPPCPLGSRQSVGHKAPGAP